MSRRAWRLRLGAWATCLIATALVLTAPAGAQTSAGIVAEVRIHGNHTTPDADVLAIVGEVIGKPATEALVTEVVARLEKSGRFEGMEVRKRFRSIENPDDILLMVVVDEAPRSAGTTRDCAVPADPPGSPARHR